MRYIAVVMAGLVWVAGARGGGFDPKAVPADAKWVLHLDVDAARASKLGQMLHDRVMSEEKARTKIDGLEKTLGLKLPDDLNDITLYGRGFTPEDGVVLIHAKIDHDKVLGLLKLNPSYDSTKYGDYDVVTWEDKGKLMHGAFHGADQIVMSRSKENVDAALDVLDGKAPALSAGSDLTAGDSAGALVYEAGTSLRGLKMGNHLLFEGQAESGWLSLAEKGDAVDIHGSVSARSPDAAGFIGMGLNGIKAWVMLAGSAEHADARTQAAAQAVQSAVLKAQDKSVSLEWSMPLTQVSPLLHGKPHEEQHDQDN